MAKKKTTDKKEVTRRLRISRDLDRIIRIRSQTFFDGNASEFIRYCVMNFKTKPPTE